MIAESQPVEIRPKAASAIPKCIVCGKQQPKYKCPRCSKPYCGLQHYRDHNLFCTEGFYKEEVERHLKQLRSTDQQRKEMKEILKRENEIPDEIPEDPYVKRYEELLDKLESGSKDIKLSHNEEVEFAKFVEQWTLEESEKQFWEIEDGLGCYFVSNYENESEEHDLLVKYRRALSQRVRQMAKLQTLCRNISPLLVYHLVNVVYAGCLVFRYFDGEVNGQTSEPSVHLNELCCVISSQSPQIADLSSSLSCLQEQIDRVAKEYRYWIYIALQDTQKVLSNKYLTIEMLARLKRIVRDKRVTKKLQFMMVFARDRPDELAQADSELKTELTHRKQRKEQADVINRIRQLKAI